MIVHELLEYCNDEHSTNCYTEETMTTSHRYKQGTGIKTQDKILDKTIYNPLALCLRRSTNTTGA